MLPRDCCWDKSCCAAEASPEHAPVFNGVLYVGKPRHVAWEMVLKHIVSNVQTRTYENFLAVTGPDAYYLALKDEIVHHTSFAPNRRLAFLHGEGLPPRDRHSDATGYDYNGGRTPRR